MKRMYRSLIALSLFLTVLVAPVSAFASTLSLSPLSGTVNKGCDIAVSINLDAQGTQTDGTDAILLFDKNAFTAKTINSGAIYPDYPGNAVDNTNGKVTVSGLASVSQPFTGAGTLATVVFTVNPTAPTGTSTIRFDFDPNNLAKTTDSNVVERSTIRDTLTSVTDGAYTIGTGACTQTSITGTATNSGIPKGGTTVIDTGVLKTLPEGALEGPALVFAVLGGLLVVVGAIGLAFL